MDNNVIFEDSFKLYQAIGGYMTNNLFWSLTYLNAALFHTPNKDDIKKTLLTLYKTPEAIVNYFYQSPAAKELVRRMEANNRLFVVYVDRCPTTQTAIKEQARRQWAENANQIARLLCELNQQWKLPECSAMLDQLVQILSLIANNTVQGNYTSLAENVPLCERLCADISEYMTKGMVDKHLV